MDNTELKRFIGYYNYYREYKYEKSRTYSIIEVIDHIYKKFGREFIYSLPEEYKFSKAGYEYILIRGTLWVHSTTEPAFHYRGKPEFFILGHCVSLDDWLPRSSLDEEGRTIFKLKYG